jgi:hypothetical protein
MRLASQVAEVAGSPRSSYLLLAKLANLNPFRSRQQRAAVQRRLDAIVNA